MPTSLLVGLGTALAGSLASKALSSSKTFGGGGGNPIQTVQNFRPPGFNAGGLNATFGGDSYNLGANADRMGAVGDVANTFGAQADSLNPLLARVAPGFGDLRSARLAEIESARQKSLGDLRENLGRRRVLGSSFASDAVSRTEAEFAQEKEKAQAESMLQEMEMTHQLQQEQFTARRQQFQTGLDEMNLEAGLAAQLTGKITDVMGKMTQAMAELQAKSQQGAGQFFGQMLPPTVAGSTKAVKDWFGGGSTDAGGSPGFFGGSPASNPNLVPIGGAA